MPFGDLRDGHYYSYFEIIYFTFFEGAAGGQI